MAPFQFADGFRFLQERRFAEAISVFQEIIKEQPELAEAHYNLGNAYVGQHDYQHALAAYREAIRLRPSFVEAHTNLGFAYARIGRHEEALAAFREAIHVEPGFVEAHLQMGLAHLEHEEFDQAIAPLLTLGHQMVVAERVEQLRQRPEVRGPVVREERPVPVRPYYAIMRLPGEQKEEFILLTLFNPSRRDNMIAWLAARSDPPNYGRLIAYQFHKQITAFLVWPADGQQFIFTSPAGGFEFLLRLCLTAGIFVAIPVIIFQLLRYLQPLIPYNALRIVTWGTVTSALLALAGMLFGVQTLDPMTFTSVTIVLALTAATAVCGLCGVHLFGVRTGKTVQNILTSSKVGATFGILGLPVVMAAAILMIAMVALSARLGVVYENSPCQELSNRLGRPVADPKECIDGVTCAGTESVRTHPKPKLDRSIQAHSTDVL
jgi:hypothetical protein